MKIIAKRGLLILVVFSLIVSIFATVGTTGEVQASGPTYVPHSTIHIDSNSDLVSLKASGDCTGSGTVSDPYIISGYDISGTRGACIYVGNITVRLVISNNYLHDNYYGIEIVKSPNVLITNNNASGNDPYGIWLRTTGNDTVANNVLIDAAHGIYTSAAYDNIMNNNTVRATRACAIMLAGDSNRNVLSNNTCYSSGDNGIYVLKSDHNTLSNNILKNNKGHGIHLADADFNNVYGNVMIGNNGSKSVYNALHPQCADTGAGNHWNTASYGNYWSDWTSPDANEDGIVDNPYSVGEGNSKDNLPLVNIYAPGTTVPGIPTGLTATPGNGQVSLAWSAPASNGGARIDYYVVYQDGVALPYHLTGLSADIPGLVGGQTYSFAVSAHNLVGMGSPSVAVMATPSITLSIPGAPTGLIATPGNAQVSLSWTAPTITGDSAIDYYIVYQDGTDVAHPIIGSTTITGLNNGQSYSFTVEAHNSAGTGPFSDSVLATPLTVPGTPNGLSASSGDGQVSLSWSAPVSNGGATIDYYIVYQNGIDIAHPATNSIIVPGLTNGVSYVYNVAAHNEAGAGSQSSDVSATPDQGLDVPGVPTGLMANPGDSQVTLSWSAPASNGGAAIDYYLVYVDGSEGTDHYTTLSSTLTELNNGQQYTFTVAAHNSVGIGTNSSEATAIPSSAPTVPSAPTGLIATPGNAQVSLTWAAPNNNGGAVIDYYLVYMNGIARSNHYLTPSTTITGLTNNQNYSFAIQAHNSVGAGAQSSTIYAIPTSVLRTPGVPLELTVNPGDAQATLSWASPNNDGGSAIDYYVVYQDGLDISHPAVTTKTVIGLTNEQSYNFTVAAHNSVGIGSLTSAVMVTPNSSIAAPGIPTDLVTTAGDGKVTLSWTAPLGSSNIDYYIVYQNGIDVLHTSATSAAITGLTDGENYSFAVAAHNLAGVGVQSPVHNISPVAATNKGAALSSGNDAMAYFAIGLALLVSAMVAAFLVVRKNRKKESDKWKNRKKESDKW